MPEPITMASLLDTYKRAILKSVWKCLPAQVLSYDATTQTANVQPMVKDVIFDQDTGERDEVHLPAIPNVPVMFARGSGYVVSVPLDAGDFVWLVFSDLSTSEFRQSGQESTPLDTRRHGLSYPVAIPGAYPDPQAITDTAVTGNDRAVFGKAGGTAQIQCKETPTPVINLGAAVTDFVALAAKVDAAIAAIRSAFNSHTHSGVQTGGGVSGTPAATISPQPSTAATVVKAQ